MKGEITFRFDCEEDTQAQAYWNAMVEASRPTTCVSVSEVVIQLRNEPAPAPTPEPAEEPEEVPPEGGFPRPKGWQ